MTKDSQTQTGQLGSMSSESATIAPKKKRTNQDMMQLTLEGVIPYQSPDTYEMPNAFIRSALFLSGRTRSDALETTDWREVEVMGKARIQVRGNQLFDAHEETWAFLMNAARGQSLSRPVSFTITDLLENSGKSKGGYHFEKAKKVLEDLQTVQLRVSTRASLEHLYRVLTNQSMKRRLDGQRLYETLNAEYGPYIDLIKQALDSNSTEDMYISMNMIQRMGVHPRSRRLIVSLDPVACLFFDGIQTTLIRKEIERDLTGLQRKIAMVAASHRDEVFPTKLYAFYRITTNATSGMDRFFRYRFNRDAKALYERGYLEAIPEVTQKKKGDDWIVYGLKASDRLRIRAKTDDLSTDEDSNDGDAPESDQYIDMDTLLPLHTLHDDGEPAGARQGEIILRDDIEA